MVVEEPHTQQTLLPEEPGREEVAASFLEIRAAASSLAASGPSAFLCLVHLVHLSLLLLPHGPTPESIPESMAESLPLTSNATIPAWLSTLKSLQ